VVELAAESDPIDDPTAVWPDGREQLDIGRLEITGVANDRERDGDVLVFDPNRLADGIAATADPILRARSDTYSVSVARRTAPA
jgi:catalase